MSTLLMAMMLTLGAVAAAVAADLPSCARAHCSHCRVPFIAQMCPDACIRLLGCLPPQRVVAAAAVPVCVFILYFVYT